MSGAPGMFFDDSLPTLIRTISEELGSEALKRGLVVRDASGRLCFLSAELSPRDEIRARLEGKLASALGAYARADRVIAFSDEPGVQLLLNDRTTPLFSPFNRIRPAFVSLTGGLSDRHGSTFPRKKRLCRPGLSLRVSKEVWGAPRRLQ